MNNDELIVQWFDDITDSRSGIEIAIGEDGENVALLNWHGPQSYDIPMSSLSTHKDVLAWTLHLAKKQWMTPRRLQIFIETVAAANGWPYLTVT